jgi:TRAP-type C4-dicarboxylate transport system substrate-binding protein
MKKFLIAFIALTLGSVASAATLKIATVTPEGSQWMKDMRDSAKEIKERTDGRVQIKYYGGGVMGNDTKVLGKIRIGALQGGAFTPAALADSYPNLNIYGMPLVFDSEEEAAYVRERLDGKLQEGLEAAGFVNFGFASGGFAIVMSNTPVKSLEDLKGKRVWVPEGDSISYASMEALSLAPVTLPLTDVLTGLQTGLIDIVAMSRARSYEEDLQKFRPRESRGQPRSARCAPEYRHRECCVRRSGSCEVARTAPRIQPAPRREGRIRHGALRRDDGLRGGIPGSR